MSDEQATMLVATVPILIAALVCLPVWAWIYTVRARRKRRLLASALWWEGVERSLQTMDFSRIRAGAVTAERIYAMPEPTPRPQLLAHLHDVVEFRGITYRARKDGNGFYLIEGPSAGDTFMYRGQPWRATIGSSNLVGPVRHIIAHPVW